MEDDEPTKEGGEASAKPKALAKPKVSAKKLHKQDVKASSIIMDYCS